MSGKGRPPSAPKTIGGRVKSTLNNFLHRDQAESNSPTAQKDKKSSKSSKTQDLVNDKAHPNSQNHNDKYYDYGASSYNQPTIHNSDIQPKNSPMIATRSKIPKADEKEKVKRIASLEQKSVDLSHRHPSCLFHSEKRWLEPQNNDASGLIMKPNELENQLRRPPNSVDPQILDQIQGSIIGMALGDALGAHVEFRPRQYLMANPVTDLVGGGTWGLAKGQFTDDTSMALCLANSLLAQRDFCPYDQLVRYKWWYQLGYMSSTGQCFDIGNATRESIDKFCERQRRISNKRNIPDGDIDYLNDSEILADFKIYCSTDGVAGNGALMRLAPVPLFFFRHPEIAVEYSGISGRITHGDRKAYDACRYYGALIVAALQGYPKKQLLSNQFYQKHRDWFGEKSLCSEIQSIAEGSYKKKRGYNDGIRGKGFIVAALEAALWAFWSDENSFETGALNAVNLGDDTDTTAAIYGQLAGAYYGYKTLPGKWLEHVYARDFMLNLSEWIVYEGEKWSSLRNPSSPNEVSPSNISINVPGTPAVIDPTGNAHSSVTLKPNGSDKNAADNKNKESKGGSGAATSYLMTPEQAKPRDESRQSRDDRNAYGSYLRGTSATETLTRNSPAGDTRLSNCVGTFPRSGKNQ